MFNALRRAMHARGAVERSGRGLLEDSLRQRDVTVLGKEEVPGRR